MVVISEKAYRIITRDGFEREFWTDLQQCRGRDVECTRRGVYDGLERLYESQFGARQFPSFEAFMKYANRKQKKA